MLVLAFLALVVLTRGLLLETFNVPSGSMEPTLTGGDRIAVWKLGSDEVSRGDVIVFDGTKTFGPTRDQVESGGIAKVVRSVGDAIGIRAGESDYVKRVIGVGGDRIQIDATGQVRVNGTAIDEPYAVKGKPGPPIDVTVPPDRLWVMGDNRADSEDSRSYLGAPGGGTVPVADVVGQVMGRYWPMNDIGRLPTGASTTTGAAS